MVIYSPVISGSLIISGSIVTTSGGLPLTGSLVSSGSFTSIGPTVISGSLTVITGSSVEFQVLDTGVRIGNLSSDNHNVTGSLLVSGSITTTGNITATTLVVQTITSSVSNITGSTRFGSLAANTHQFTGSVLVSGSLGIGTSPSSPLDVVADNSTAINLRLRGRVLDNVGQMEFWNNAQSTRYGYIATDSVSMGIVTTQNLPLVLGTNSTERMRISGSNVGIGTTNPISQFHINGSTGGTFTDGLRINRNGNANQYTVINHVGGASNFMTVDTSGNNIAEMYFQRSINGTAATSSMMINTNGNVGIGTTSPTTPLHISGSASQMVRITTNGALSSGFYDAFQMLATSQTGGGLSLNIGKAESQNNLAKMVYFHSSDGSTSNRLGFGFFNNDALFNILASGNVGIGTSDATHRLTMQNGTSEVGIRMTDGTNNTYFAHAATNGNFANGSIAGDAVIRASNGISFAPNNGSATTLRLTSTGAATFSSSVTATSFTANGSGTNDLLYLDAGVNTDFAFKIVSGANDVLTLRRQHSTLGNLDIMSYGFNGNVGIGTSPNHKLDVNGDINIPGTNRIVFNNEPGSWGITARTTTSTANLGAALKNIIISGGGASEGIAFTGVGTGAAAMEVRNDGAVWVKGTLTKGGGSFRIDHPLPEKKDTHFLYHSFIEGPKADLIYRGKINLVNGTASVNIDEVSTMTEGTFELLTRDAQCFVNNLSGWDLVKGNITGNILTITSQNIESTDEISWMVVAERNDEWFRDSEMTDDNGNTIVEKLKPIIEEIIQ